MTISAEEIMTNGGQDLPLQCDLRDALSIYARRTWPRDTAKQMARSWALPLSTSQNILKGHASAATITHVLRIGGWGLSAAVMGAVIGESLEGFIASEKTRLRNERRQYEAESQRLVEMASHLRSRRPVGHYRPPKQDPAELRVWRE
ncbi:MAG: hypothetical protein EON59_14970 [Alphaproteobacteria bacterium]|nr:MAG: hypothetical protein EON59_14970 [Alphaproteobacteria bacterium]